MKQTYKLESIDELDRILGQEISKTDAAETIVHAGHYALVEKSGILTDCLNDSRFPNVGMGFAEFAQTTWQAACQATARARHLHEVKLMVLVNDWQHVTANAPARHLGESHAAKGREDYYRLTNRLPLSHLSLMAKSGLDESFVFRNNNRQWLFSETALRKELNEIIQETLADPVRAQEAGLHKYFNEAGEPIVAACDDEAGQICLLYCGNTNCAGEVISLLRNLYLRGVRHFINIFPYQCNHPVGVGTRLAHQLFGLDAMRVTNVAVQQTNGSNPLLRAVVEDLVMSFPPHLMAGAPSSRIAS